jgi:hypothetical protein
MINTLYAENAQRLLDDYDFRPPLELPAHADGTLDLDEIHVPAIERIRAVQQEVMPGLETFAHAYPTPGSSQAMFTLMAEWHAKGEMRSLAVVDGEYEGYSAYAEQLRIPVKRFANLTDAGETKEGRVWFLSNPSATDGNWIETERFKNFLAAGHETVLDAAYTGLTTEGALDVSAPNIRSVLTSPSKIYGVFRYRETGITYTREPVGSMYGTKWFKDVPALLDTVSLYEKFGARGLSNRYKGIQEFLCEQLSNVVEAPVEASDVLLLGHTEEQVAEPFRHLARGAIYRFGLTKLFEDLEMTARSLITQHK